MSFGYRQLGFYTITIKDVTLRNRIALPPMCQYMAINGMVNEWHLSHYASIARGGAGLVIVEATAVAPEGRITPGCTGIWSDQQAQAFVPVVQVIKAAGAVAGIQIGHAGRACRTPLQSGGINILAILRHGVPSTVGVREPLLLPLIYNL